MPSCSSQHPRYSTISRTTWDNAMWPSVQISREGMGPSFSRRGGRTRKIREGSPEITLSVHVRCSCFKQRAFSRGICQQVLNKRESKGPSGCTDCACRVRGQQFMVLVLVLSCTQPCITQEESWVYSDHTVIAWGCWEQLEFHLHNVFSQSPEWWLK